MMDSKPICCEESYVSLALGWAQSVLAKERKVLGICWDPTTDQLIMSVVDVAHAASHLEPTTRAIVNLVGRIYDPLGILTPIIVSLKVFIQELCEVKLRGD